MAQVPDAGTPEANRGRVLVVEDHPATSRFMVRVLERAGFEAWAAADATEALRLLASEPCDAALVDVRLPGMSGFDLVRRLRGGAAQRAHRGTPGSVRKADCFVGMVMVAVIVAS